MEAMASHGVVTLFVLPLLVALSLPDLAIAMVGAAFGGAMTLFTGFVHSSWEMFLSEFIFYLSDTCVCVQLEFC